MFPPVLLRACATCCHIGALLVALSFTGVAPVRAQLDAWSAEGRVDASAAPAAAQPPDVTLPEPGGAYVTPGPYREPSSDVAHLVLPSTPIDRHAWDSQRRARLMIPVGAAIAASGLVYFGLGSRKNDEGNDAPGIRRLGLTLSAAGIGLAVSGGVWLAVASRRQRYAPTWGQKGAMIATGVGTFALMQLPVLMALLLGAVADDDWST